MTETQASPAPMIPDVAPEEIGANVYVIPDHRIDLVPNVGIVVGEDAVLVVDTGMGLANGRRVLERARELAAGRPLLLTLTHFHPEHGFGAQAFEGEAVLVYNRVQKEELDEKFAEFVEMFSGFAPAIADILADVRLVVPRITYVDAADIDLGGTTVQLRYFGPAHTRGDQVVFLPGPRILFAGDLVENRFFPILPDPDAHGSLWIDLLERLDGLGPAVVVPGHGAVGGAGLIREVRDYLVDVRARVRGLREAGQDLDGIRSVLEPEIRGRYESCDNPMWIAFAIDNFHAELDG